MSFQKLTRIAIKDKGGKAERLEMHLLLQLSQIESFSLKHKSQMQELKKIIQ